MIAQSDFSIRDILVYIKVLQFLQFEVFGGIDPNVIRLTEGQLFIYPSLYFDLALSERDFVDSLHRLLDCGFLHWKAVTLVMESIDCHNRLRAIDSEPGLRQRITGIIKKMVALPASHDSEDFSGEESL